MPDVSEVLEQGALEAIEGIMDLLATYAVSAQMAARRGDREPLKVHLKQARLVVIEALKTHKDYLGGVGS